jgi:pyruvate/2-oxoglutarate dehydrogenase complex dihydrolipoamide acyltransferase (E2) component
VVVLVVVAVITAATIGAFTTTPDPAPAPAPTAAPAPLTGAVVPASPSAAPALLTSSAAPVPAPVPAPAVYASGTVDDLGTKEGIDLDTGQRRDQNAPGVDISFSSTSTHMDAMHPSVYYQVLPQPVTQPEKRMCDIPTGWAREYKYVHDLTEGRNICVRTDEGRLSMMTVTKRATKATGTISLRFVTWP